MVIKNGLRLVLVEPNTDRCDGCVFDGTSCGCPVVDDETDDVLICNSLGENRHWIDASGEQ